MKGDPFNPLLSWFKSAYENLPDYNVHGLELFELIRGPRFAQQIQGIREKFQRALLATNEDRAAAKKAVDHDKKRLPAVTFSGLFGYRAKEHIQKHSGLMQADLDQLGSRLAETRARLTADLHVFLLFTSPTGDGLKAIFRVPNCRNEAEHLAAFRAVEKQVRELCGVEIDGACKDSSRLCYLSWDPEVRCNPQPVELPFLGVVEPTGNSAVDTPAKDSELHEPVKTTTAVPGDLGTRRKLADEILGPVRWESESAGFCTCPGKSFHTTGDGERDCRVTLDGVPTAHCFHNHCRETVADANRRLRARLDSVEWPDPDALPDDMPAVAAFNFAWLPDTLRPWLEDVAERMQCPADYPAAAMLVALGSLIGRKVGIRPKREDDWLVVSNLWGFVVGHPGLMKTPALEQALVPLRQLATEAFERYSDEMKRCKVSGMLAAQRAKLAEKQIAKALARSDESAAQAAAETVVNGKHADPILHRYELNDTTVQKLGELLAENPNGVLVFRDELVGFLRSMDKDGYEESRAFYLEAWTGTGSYTFDRIGRGTVRVPSNTVAILGGIQPDLLTVYVREAVKGGGGADGLLQRFQVAVWPDASKVWCNVDRLPNWKGKGDAFAVFHHLDKSDAAAVGADCSAEIPFLRFAPDAQEQFDLWREKLEHALRSHVEHSAFEAHLAKYRKLVPAIALILHLADRATGPVTLDALNKALAWAGYLQSHARRIYSAALQPDAAAARELAKHLERGDLGDRFTLRDVYRKGWTGLDDKEDTEAAVEILCEFGWLRPARSAAATAGRPGSPEFEVNPKIRDANATD